MRIVFLTIALAVLALTAKSQNASVEKSVFGVQTGLLGFWAHNELKLTNLIALRTEIGIAAGFSGSRLVTIPVITAEPRWYYNLNKRERESKRIDGNSGNFLSLKTSFQPNLVITPSDNSIRNNVSVIPTWGIRRNIGQHFNVEVGAGVGYMIFFRNAHHLENDGSVAVNVHYRIGYRF